MKSLGRDDGMGGQYLGSTMSGSVESVGATIESSTCDCYDVWPPDLV
jgi:hypothetical protein